MQGFDDVDEVVVKMVLIRFGRVGLSRRLRVQSGLEGRPRERADVDWLNPWI